jgi:hypothetical protein
VAARDSHDRFPDIRRQAVPARDKLAQSQIRAGSMQTGGRGVDASTFLQNDLRNLGRGCNSRRLHFFFYNSFFKKTCVNKRHAYVTRRLDKLKPPMLIVSISLRTICVVVPRTALIRFSSQFAGVAIELPAKVRRRPILDADETEGRSVSSD